MTTDKFVSFVSEGEVRVEVARLFDQVARRIAEILPNASIHHVGSTSIPGSLTKGDLDVQVRVVQALYDASKERLSELYEINEGGFVADDAVSFEDYSTQPAHGVHLTVIGGSGDIQWRFRDTLIASNELRQQYDQLKRDFESRSMDSYRGAKEEFVLRVQNSDIYRALTAPRQLRE